MFHSPPGPFNDDDDGDTVPEMPELNPDEVLELRTCRWLGTDVMHIRGGGPPVWAVAIAWSESGFDDELMSNAMSLIPQAELLCALSWAMNNYSEIAPQIERIHEMEAADPNLERKRRTYWRAPWPRAEDYV